nr:transmembrane protein 68-like [Ciona intestinalis]|eukprot:XP_009862213.2 transmembrane protein 68-like [Ciona intestinalis]
MLHYLVQWITCAIHFLLSFVDYYLSGVVLFLNHHVPGWRLYLFSPFVITFFILPMLLVVYLYLSALLLFVYHRRHSIIDAFHHRDLWEGYRRTMAAFWGGHGWIWHGYEVVGMQNIPDTGPALIIYYHGAFPIDIYYLVAHIYMEKGRVMRNVMDNFAFKIPGLASLFRFWGSFPGPRSKVVDHLNEGEIVSIAPGGVREALFSENYSLVWQSRQGFAKAAIDAKVPIIPVFTENCRQAFDFIGTGKKIFRMLYERTRWPLMPMYGGFPVKMRTYIGAPIPYDPTLTPYELVSKVRKVLEHMIRTHQTPNKSVVMAIIDRFRQKQNYNSAMFNNQKNANESSNALHNGTKLSDSNTPTFIENHGDSSHSTHCCRIDNKSL